MDELNADRHTHTDIYTQVILLLYFMGNVSTNQIQIFLHIRATIIAHFVAEIYDISRLRKQTATYLCHKNIYREFEIFEAFCP